MPEQAEMVERRMDVLQERLAVLEKLVEFTLEGRVERLIALEQVVKTALEGSGGVLERLTHLDKCMDAVKKTVWLATGALAIISFAANYFTRGH